jgi:hypothetical protein
MRTCANWNRGRMDLAAFPLRPLVVALLAMAGVGTAAAQGQPQGPPAFVTLPRHPAIDAAANSTDHKPFRLELRNEMYELVGVDAPNQGGGGGGKNGGGVG